MTQLFAQMHDIDVTKDIQVRYNHVIFDIFKAPPPLSYIFLCELHRKMPNKKSVFPD